MGIKEGLRHGLGRAGVFIDRGRKHGYQRFADLAAARAPETMRTVVDAGANVGQSVTQLRALFGEAHIHAFEPGRAALRELRATHGSDRNVTILDQGLAAEAGTAELVETAASDFAYVRGAGTVCESASEEARGAVAATYPVTLTTLDRYAADVGLTEIDILKIDTEGFDLEVLKGAAGLLAAQRIDVVQAEVGLRPGNPIHVPLWDVAAFLEGHGYGLFGLYDQIPSTLSSRVLERADALFRPLR